MAVYAFYKIIAAGRDIVRFRHTNSPVISAAKAVNLAAALASMLSLETAMLSQFGGGSGEGFRAAMTGATGAVVCAIILGIAVFMICRATKMIQRKAEETI